MQINGQQSTCEVITSGIKQGGIISPALFGLVVRFLPRFVNHSACYLFADETLIAKTISTQNDIFDCQEDINGIVDWSKETKFVRHPDKMEVLSVTMRKKEHALNNSLFVGNVAIKAVNLHKHLGVIIDADLNFNAQYDNMVSRAYAAWKFIKLTAVKISPSLYVVLYNSFVLTIIEYANLACWPNQGQCDRIEMVQKKASKFIYHIHKKHNTYCDDYKLVLSDLGMESLEVRRKRKCFSLLKRIYMQKHHDIISIPQWWTEQIIFKQTRRHGILTETATNRLVFTDKKIFFNIASDQFNSLPDNIRVLLPETNL